MVDAKIGDKYIRLIGWFFSHLSIGGDRLEGAHDCPQMVQSLIVLCRQAIIRNRSVLERGRRIRPFHQILTQNYQGHTNDRIRISRSSVRNFCAIEIRPDTTSLLYEEAL